MLFKFEINNLFLVTKNVLTNRHQPSERCYNTHMVWNQQLTQQTLLFLPLLKEFQGFVSHRTEATYLHYTIFANRFDVLQLLLSKQIAKVVVNLHILTRRHDFRIPRNRDGPIPIPNTRYFRYQCLEGKYRYWQKISIFRYSEPAIPFHCGQWLYY